ncbi:unnamed protein product [uncultured virus]|nr:unnamed protein product [uncultured virus]
MAEMLTGADVRDGDGSMALNRNGNDERVYDDRGQ